MKSTYLTVKNDYEKRKTNYNFVVRNYGRKRQQFIDCNQVLNGIIKYLDSAINETDFIIGMVDGFDRDNRTNMMFSVNFRHVIDAAKVVIENTSNLIERAMKEVSADDPMSLEGIRNEAREGVMGIVCNASRIHHAINKLIDN